MNSYFNEMIRRNSSKTLLLVHLNLLQAGIVNTRTLFKHHPLVTSLVGLNTHKVTCMDPCILVGWWVRILWTAVECQHGENSKVSRHQAKRVRPLPPNKELLNITASIQRWALCRVKRVWDLSQPQVRIIKCIERKIGKYWVEETWITKMKDLRPVG